MTIIGDAFVALRPDAAGFGREAEAGITKGLSGLAIGGGIAVAGAVIAGTLLKIGSSFEDAFSTIQRQTGVTGVQLTQLEGIARGVFASTPSSLKDVTAAMDEVFIRTGATGNALKTLTTQEVDFARITKADVASTVDATTSLLNKMGVATKDQSAALDTLFKGTQVSGKGIDSMAGDLTKVTPILQGLNFSFGQQVALVAGLEKSGARVQSVTTGLAKVFAAAAKSGQDPLKLFATLTNELRTASTQTEATTIAVQNFGVRAGPELARAIRAGNLDLGTLFAKITSGKDGIIATANSTETLGERFKQFKNTAVNELEPIGMKLLDLATKQLPHLQNALTDAFFVGVVGAHDFQEGLNGVKLPDNAPLLAKFFNDLGLAIHNLTPGAKTLFHDLTQFFTVELPIDLQAAGDTWDHWVERFRDGATRVKGDLGDIVHVMSPSFLIDPFAHIGVKPGVPTLTPGVARANLNAFEAAHGTPVGGINATIAPQLAGASAATVKALNDQLGHGSPVLTEAQKQTAYLKAISDWIHNNGASPFTGTKQQAQQRLASDAGAGMAARVAHLS